jgi:hypothetical protein
MVQVEVPHLSGFVNPCHFIKKEGSIQNVRKNGADIKRVL